MASSVSDAELNSIRDRRSSLGYSESEKSRESVSIHQVNSSRSNYEPSRSNYDPDSFDPNYDPNAEDIEDDSPYPEVRCAVANVDDPEMPASTIRAWTIGLFWAIVIPGLNELYHYRYPSVVIPPLVAQLLSFPMGRFWARVMPRWTIFGLPLNPGEFSIKEHVLLTIMAGVSPAYAYATEIIAVQRTTYNQHPSFLFSWLLVMSTQLMGFSLGGVARRFLVEPASMIWPNTLVSSALFNTLHSSTYSGIGQYTGMKRERLFMWVFFSATVWCFFPEYLFQALQWFTWACWIAPNNVIVNQLFGQRSGLAFSMLSFDWNVIAFANGSPLATPWWAEANILGGFVFFYWLLVPILYYTNTWHAQYLPVSSRFIYTNTGALFNVTQILDDNKRLDIAKYKAYSPVFMATTLAVSYGTGFSAVTATLSHAIIYFRKPIMARLRRSYSEPPDIHMRLMSAYPQVPEWWYASVLVVTLTFGLVCIQQWDVQLPVWGLVLALVISAIYLIPIGMIKATTNSEVGLNVITELIVGYALPGRPIAMMLFKTWGYITMTQAMIYSADIKLGHYMKIPPRATFWAQVVATAIGGTVQLGVQNWMFANVKDICTIDQPQGFVCAGTQTFAVASVLWGVIGPERIFSKGQVYYGLVWFFFAGAMGPPIVYLLTKRYPNSWLNYINVPLILVGIGYIPPATAVNYIPWGVVGWFFNYYLRHKHPSWWAKYCYVISAALDAGTGTANVLIYFCLQYPLDGNLGKNTIQNWWGNTVYKNTADWRMTPLKPLRKGGSFGPESW